MVVPNNANTFLPPSPMTPGALLISNITNANPAVVTVIDTDENTYQVGQLVHFTVPASYGMFQINQQTAQITFISGLNFTVSLDTLQYDVFVIPATYQPKPASLGCGGSRNLTIDNFTQKVPFQSLDGSVGN